METEWLARPDDIDLGEQPTQVVELIRHPGYSRPGRVEE